MRQIFFTVTVTVTVGFSVLLGSFAFADSNYDLPTYDEYFSSLTKRPSQEEICLESSGQMVLDKNFLSCYAGDQDNKKPVGLYMDNAWNRTLTTSQLGLNGQSGLPKFRDARDNELLKLVVGEISEGAYAKLLLTKFYNMQSQLHGEIRIINRNVTVANGKLFNNFFFPNPMASPLLVGQYANDKKVGIWRQFDQNNQLRYLTEYGAEEEVVLDETHKEGMLLRRFEKATPDINRVEVYQEGHLNELQLLSMQSVSVQPNVGQSSHALSCYKINAATTKNLAEQPKLASLNCLGTSCEFSALSDLEKHGFGEITNRWGDTKLDMLPKDSEILSVELPLPIEELLNKEKTEDLHSVCTDTVSSQVPSIISLAEQRYQALRASLVNLSEKYLCEVSKKEGDEWSRIYSGFLAIFDNIDKVVSDRRVQLVRFSRLRAKNQLEDTCSKDGRVYGLKSASDKDLLVITGVLKDIATKLK